MNLKRHPSPLDDFHKSPFALNSSTWNSCIFREHLHHHQKRLHLVAHLTACAILWSCSHGCFVSIIQTCKQCRTHSYMSAEILFHAFSVWSHSAPYECRAHGFKVHKNATICMFSTTSYKSYKIHKKSANGFMSFLRLTKYASTFWS